MVASYSAAAKAEICRTLPNKSCCALAECFGVLLFCNSFDHDGNVSTPAGNMYSIRYEEALALECAYQRWLGEQRDAKIIEYFKQQEKIANQQQ